MKNKPKIVSFQLEDEHLRRLEKEGKQFNQSAGQYARQLVFDALEDASTERLEKRMIMLETEVSEMRQELRHEMKELHDSLTIAVEALLIKVARMSPEQVREWADRNLRPH